MKIFLQTKQTTRLANLVQISIFSAIAVVLTFWEIPMWLFGPGFYKLGLSDAIVLISGFSLGPLAGVLTELLKVTLRLLLRGTSTFGLGEFANLVAGIALVLPSAAFYKGHRTFKGAVVAMLLGIASLTVMSGVLNYFVLLPLDAALFSVSESTIVSWGNAVNQLITNKFMFVLLLVCPFNLLKGSLVCCFTLIFYKKLSAIINDFSSKIVK